MTTNWVNKIDINVNETLSVVLHNKTEFIVRRIPDVPYPSFFILSASIVIFYVTITDTLNLFVVMEKQRSAKPFITSTKFHSKNITFKLGKGKEKEGLGCCIAKENVVWDITKANLTKEKLYEIVSRSDGLSCRILKKNETIGEMNWEPYWTTSDTKIFNTNDLPPNASYTLKCNINLEPEFKALIIVSTFVVHYGQKQLTPKKCTKKTTIILGLAIFFLLLTAFPLVFYLTTGKNGIFSF